MSEQREQGDAAAHEGLSRLVGDQKPVARVAGTVE